jgi:probable phosphoglycerate mutase
MFISLNGMIYLSSKKGVVMAKVLYLMRHGETLFNKLNRIQGVCDSPLTEWGIHQAKVAKKYLEGIAFDHYYCSTSERSSDTLELVIGDQPYTRVKELKEFNFGVFEGQSDYLEPKKIEDYDTFFIPYGGEGAKDMEKRVIDALTGIMEKEDHETVLAISHSGTSTYFLMHWEKEADKILKDGIGNCTILKYEYEDKKFKLLDIIRPEF